ncbi:hypothetical protein PF007_g16298 [Phytophthora fragariae]|uniref:Uncharacterized protein n=1 Tax=Phytophthora fragariae TaxID=53985 RepID=A0A6A3RKL0_9STRA|nr:hypothetical protein PF003_g4968 [Phytophthora fragariae]KAE9098357.1 hypothetical protein PF007_g16298 [Phytophthora fragariae]
MVEHTLQVLVRIRDGDQKSGSTGFENSHERVNSEVCYRHIAAELERAVGGLAALYAPVVTGEGHAVLVAWKRGSDAHDPLTTFLLTAADGVHKQLGDASSEFILMIEAAVIHAAQGLRREQDARSDVDRARLSRAFSGLKWELQREIQKIGGLQLAVPVEVNCETMQPSKQFTLIKYDGGLQRSEDLTNIA